VNERERMKDQGVLFLLPGVPLRLPLFVLSDSERDKRERQERERGERERERERNSTLSYQKFPEEERGGERER
jgi:hypothetical protein